MSLGICVYSDKTAFVRSDTDVGQEVHIFFVLVLLLATVWNSAVSDATEDRRFLHTVRFSTQQLRTVSHLFETELLLLLDASISQ